MFTPLPAVVVPVPRVRAPKDAVCANRFVDDAVVEKKLVLVAFARVVLPETASVEPRVVAPVTVLAPTIVEEALLINPLESVWRLLQVLAVVVPNASESVFAEKLIG
jgi:hypothetical protein